MNQNIVVDLIDEELGRLRQARAIFASLLPDMNAEDLQWQPSTGDDVAESTLSTVAADAEAADREQSFDSARKVSRRGIRTGPRGPRPRSAETTPRALDNVVPSGPVVVSPASRPTVPTVVKPRAKTAPAGKLDKLDSLLAAAMATMQ